MKKMLNKLKNDVQVVQPTLEWSIFYKLNKMIFENNQNKHEQIDHRIVQETPSDSMCNHYKTISHIIDNDVFVLKN